MKIPYEYCNIKNFGDQLNPLIFKLFTDIDIIKDNNRFADVIGIGSILDGLFHNDQDADVSPAPLNVFSTGFGDDTTPVPLKRTLYVFALRGKKSFDKLKHLKNVKFIYGSDTVLGDGGLLASYLVRDIHIEKIYDLGICPHYADKNDPVFKKMAQEFGKSVFILDPTKDPVNFLCDLMKCKAVISTAMHPLIACDSLRIPNMWVRVSETTTTRFKFYDYYSAFGLKKEPFNLQNGFHADDLKKVYKNYNISDKLIFDKQKELISVLCDIKEILIRDSVDIQKRYKKHIKTRFFIKFICNFIPFKSIRRKLRMKY